MQLFAVAMLEAHDNMIVSYNLCFCNRLDHHDRFWSAGAANATVCLEKLSMCGIFDFRAEVWFITVTMLCSNSVGSCSASTIL